MNPKQTAPLILTLATVAPPLLIGGAIGYGIAQLLKCLLEDSKEVKPETMPAIQKSETNWKTAEIGQFHSIPAESPAKPASVSPAIARPSLAIQPASAQPIAVTPSALQPVELVAKAEKPATPETVSKKFITRADMTTIFDNGARSLTRTASVAALKRLGFGKTAAYAALSPDGRFSAWLQFTPDGIITWTDEPRK